MSDPPLDLVEVTNSSETYTARPSLSPGFSRLATTECKLTGFPDQLTSEHAMLLQVWRPAPHDGTKGARPN